MIKDLIGTILGRKDPMYRFIYYHSFKRFLLTYFLFALGWGLIKIFDAFTLARLDSSINAIAYLQLTWGTIIPTIALLAVIISIVAIFIFVAAKAFGKKANFAQLFFAMHSILPFFLIVKLMQSLAIFFAYIPIVSVIFHWLLLASLLYFIFIIMAKTASYFTTMSFGQSMLVMAIITTIFAGIIYWIYLSIIEFATSLT